MLPRPTSGFCCAGSLPPNDKLVIGLNPPFGKNGTLAALFAGLAARHKPRIIVLIVPPQTAVRPPNILQKSPPAFPYTLLQFLMAIAEGCCCHGERLYPLRLIPSSNSNSENVLTRHVLNATMQCWKRKVSSSMIVSFTGTWWQASGFLQAPAQAELCNLPACRYRRATPVSRRTRA